MALGGSASGARGTFPSPEKYPKGRLRGEGVPTPPPPLKIPPPTTAFQGGAAPSPKGLPPLRGWESGKNGPAGAAPRQTSEAFAEEEGGAAERAKPAACGGMRDAELVPTRAPFVSSRKRGARGRNPIERVSPPVRPFAYFSGEGKVGRGPGAEPPKSFGKKHVSPPPARRRANLSPSAPIAGTERSNPGCGAGEAPFYPRGVNPTDSSTSRPASETTKSRKSWACSWCSLMFSTAAG